MSRVPVGLEDVSKFPNLFAELIRRGYSDEDVEKVARLNLIRVLQAVENVRIGSVLYVHVAIFHLLERESSFMYG